MQTYCDYFCRVECNDLPAEHRKPKSLVYPCFMLWWSLSLGQREAGNYLWFLRSAEDRVQSWIGHCWNISYWSMVYITPLTVLCSICTWTSALRLIFCWFIGIRIGNLSVWNMKGETLNTGTCSREELVVLFSLRSSFKQALEALPQLSSGTDKKWVW